MSEPGEDGFELTPPPQADPDDHCSCPKEPGCYGKHGRHWRRNDRFPASAQMSAAYERCPRYMEAVGRSGGFRKPQPKRRKA